MKRNDSTRRNLCMWMAGSCLGAARAAAGARFTKTPRGTYEVAWPGGNLELNFTPMSRETESTSGVPVRYTVMRDDASLYLPIADVVGITALRLDGAPAVPRVLWDNREHHFWDGHEGSFEPRNVVVNDPRIEQSGDAVHASYYFIADHVQTTIRWEFKAPVNPACRANWTTTIEVTNRRQETLRNYVQFLACYHKAATNYYWDVSNKIRSCPAGGFTATRDEAFNERLRRTPYHAHMNRYREKNAISYGVYRRPVLFSGKELHFAGMRHITMSDPETCAGIVTWNEQARDYLITPPDFDLKPGASFRARIRHLIAPAETPSDLEILWRGF
jgi:hypothetical protein